MKVYKVTAVAWEDELVIGLYSNKEKAKKAMRYQIGNQKILNEYKKDPFNEHVIYYCVLEKNSEENFKQYQIEEFDIE